MAKLSFDINANYDKVVELRKEISRLEDALSKVTTRTPKQEIQSLESELSDARDEFKSLTQAAMEAGTKVEAEFKTKMKTASEALGEVTDRIKKQKEVISSAEQDVQRYGNAYANAVNKGRKGVTAKSQLDDATENLNKQRKALEALVDEQTKAQSVVDQLDKEYEDLNNSLKEGSQNTDAMGMAFTKMAAALGGVAALKQLGAQIVQVRAQFQDMETQIETLVGKDVTAKIMPDIREMAKTSPLTMTDIINAEKTMLSFNIDAEQSVKYLKALSDVSMGNSQKFNSLALAFSQVSSAGKLMGQDLLQMINAGFNPLQSMAEKTGKSISELKEEMSKGAISAQMVQQAFIDATSEGGKFFGMSSAASQTINGQISMMEDAMDAAFNELGIKSEGVILKSIQLVTKLIENYEKVGKAIITLTASYGAYRAAVIITTTVEKIATAAKAKDAAATGLLTMAVEKLKNAMLKLKAVQTGTWIGIAAAALTALAGAIWTFTSKKKEEKEAIEETNKSITDEVEKVATLKEEINNVNTSNERRIEILKELKNINPDIVEGIKEEAVALDLLNENIEAYNALKTAEGAINQSEEKAEYDKNKAAWEQANSEVEQAKRDVVNSWTDVKKQIISSIEGGEVTESMSSWLKESVLDPNVEVYDALQKINKKYGDEFFNKAKWLYNEKDKAAIEKWVDATHKASGAYSLATERMARAEKSYAAAAKSLETRISETVDNLVPKVETATKIKKKLAFLWGGDTGVNADGTGGAEGTSGTNTDQQIKFKEDSSKTWEQATKDAQSAYNAAKKALDTAKKEGKTVAELKTYQDALEKAKEKLLYYNPNALRKGGSSGTKQHAAQKELVERKNQLALERKAHDAEHNMKMSAAQAIADDEEREREVRALENAKTLELIKRNKEDYINALVSAEVDKQVAAKKKKIDVAAIRSEVEGRQDVQSYDAQYANAQQRQGNEDAKREKEKLDAQRKAWQDYYIEYGTYQEKRQYLAEQYEDKITQAEKNGLEGEVASLKAEKDRVLAELEKGMNAQYQNIFKDPEKMTGAAISEAIRLGQEEITKITAKGTLNDKDTENLKVLQEAVDRLQEYETTSPFAHWGDGMDGIISKLTEIDVIQRRIAEAKKTGNKEAQEAAEMELAASQESLKKNIKGLAAQSVIGGLEKVAETMHEIAEITGDVKLEEMAKQFDSLTTSLNSALMGLMMGGPLGMFLSLAMTFLTSFINSIQEFFTFGAANTAALKKYTETLESMDLMLNLDKFDSIFGEDRWGKIAAASDTLRKNLEAIDNLTFTQIEPAIQATGMAIGGQIKSKEQRTHSGLSLSEVFVNAKGKGKQKNSGTLQELFGEDLFDENGNLRTDKIEEAKAALESLKGMKLADDTAIKALEKGIEYAENVKAAGDALKDAATEYMGGIAQTFGDALVNNILRGVDAMDDLGAAGAEIITQLGRDLAQTWVMQNYLNQFEAGMQQAFIDNDQEKIANIVGDIVSGFPAMMETGSELVKQLYDSTKDTKYDVYEYAKEQQQQQASQKGYAALSEETGSELSGRALAQYESNLRIEASQREQTASIVEIKASMLTSLTQQMAIKNVADDCRRILAETQIDVRAILNNTEAMVKPIANLSSKMDKWDSKIMSL